MEGSTFTVSKFKECLAYRSLLRSSINPIHSIRWRHQEKPVVKEDAIVVGNTMKLTLARDHRTVDGATGAHFYNL